MSEFSDWVDDIKKNTPPPQVDDHHVPTQNERNNVCYLAMKMIAGWPMRQADLAIVEAMAKQHCGSLTDLRGGYCSTLGEYIWDHLMGEPEEPTCDEVIEACRAYTDQLFSMDEKTRNAI